MTRTSRRSLLLLVLLAGSLLLGTGIAEADDGSTSHPPINVYYVAQAGGARTEDPVLQALTLTDLLNVVDSLDQADAIVVYNAWPSFREISAVRDRGLGIVLFMGPQLDTQLAGLGDLGLGWGGGWGTEPISIEPVPGVSDPVLDQIAWTSAPQIKARSMIAGVNGGPELEALVRTADSHELILEHLVAGNGKVYVFAPWIPPDEAHNPDLLEWPYWNYLVYHLTARAAGETPLGYADYPGSPVPHAEQKTGLVAVLAIMLAGTVGAFVLVRRYSLRHPEALDHIVASYRRYRKLQQSPWEEVGFHRPLAGFLFLVAVVLVLFIVLFIYQQAVLFGTLLKSAQARVVWSLITTFFATVWVLFDWGTGTAFVKFFAERRVDDPRDGIKYAQFYIWWQAITGTVQLGLILLLAAFVVPETSYAFMSYYLILHALIQFPGFFMVFQNAFRAYQKQDYDQVLNLVLYLTPIVVQTATVYLFIQWGAANPIFGRSMAGVFGLGIGVYLSHTLVFVVGYLLFKRLGYSASLLFMAHFDRETITSALRFGTPITIAGVAGGLGYIAQTALIGLYILNWTEVQGNWDVVSPQGLLLAYGAVGGLYQGIMPAISEAFSHGRLTLTCYYVAQGFKYGALFSVFVTSALIGVGDRFILGALGEDYQRAAGLVVAMGLWGMIQFPAWFSDRFQEGTGRPDLQMWMVILEQSVRIIFMILLMPSLGLTGLILAYLMALGMKAVLAWWLNGQLILPFRIYWWQTAVAPLLAGVINWALLRFLGTAMGGEEINQIAAVVLFFIALLPSLPVFFFFNGLFGGWDDAGLVELRRAAGLSSLGKPIAWLIYYATSLGARLSPLHGRFPIDVHGPAQLEASTLTAERVSLVRS